MSSPTEIKLRMAEIYTRDLEADTDQHLQLLKQLHDDLVLKHAIGRGTYSVARKRLDAATRATEALLRQISAHRELLNDLRATLNELRKTVSGELHTTGARRTPHQEN
jgi:chromosome segregation ATPase